MKERNSPISMRPTIIPGVISDAIMIQTIYEEIESLIRRRIQIEETRGLPTEHTQRILTIDNFNALITLLAQSINPFALMSFTGLQSHSALLHTIENQIRMKEKNIAKTDFYYYPLSVEEEERLKKIKLRASHKVTPHAKILIYDQVYKLTENENNLLKILMLQHLDIQNNDSSIPKDSTELAEMLGVKNRHTLFWRISNFRSKFIDFLEGNGIRLFTEIDGNPDEIKQKQNNMLIKSIVLEDLSITNNKYTYTLNDEYFNYHWVEPKTNT